MADKPLISSILGGAVSAPANPTGVTFVNPNTAQEAAQLSLVPQRELRADLLWAASGDGKDTNLWMATYYMAKTKGKKSLLLTAESLGTGMQLAQKAGLVDVISIAGQERPLDIVAHILKGRKWPKKIETKTGTTLDFKSKEAEINSEEVGLLIINSMTSIADQFKLEMAIEGRVRLPMSPGKDKYNVIINGVSLTGSAPTHVGFIHDRMYEYVVASTYLPTERVLWTARQSLGAIGEKKDKDGNVVKVGIPVFGPELPGSAATHRVTGWFGGAYHLDKVQVGTTEDKREDAKQQAANAIPKYEYRLWLQKHHHPDFGVPFDVKNRLPAELNAKLLDVNGPTKGKPYIVCTETRQGKGFVHTGINTVWKLEEDYIAKTTSEINEDLAEVLGKFKKGVDSTSNT